MNQLTGLLTQNAGSLTLWRLAGLASLEVDEVLFLHDVRRGAARKNVGSLSFIIIVHGYTLYVSYKLGVHRL
jgi:hypothetical protein